MSKFWSSTPSSSDGEDSDGSSEDSDGSSDDSDGSSEDSDGSSEDSDECGDLETGLFARLSPSTPPPIDRLAIDGDSFSTPPRRPILPVDHPAEAWRIIGPDQTFAPVPTVETRHSGIGGGAADRSPFVRIALISDTHGYHDRVVVPPCDVLIHGGDFTNYGEPDMVRKISRKFGEWKQSGTVRHEIVCIAGNHELTFQPEHYERVWKRFHHREKDKLDASAARSALTNCTYLEDQSCAVADGALNVYGSPWQPTFYDWAFNAERSEIGSKWENIPSGVDVLVTHGPPLGRCDVNSSRTRTGCVSLLREVQERIRPRLHVYGHIHEGYGVSFDGSTVFVNASVVKGDYSVRTNPCIVVDVPLDKNALALVVEPKCDLSADETLTWLKRNGLEVLAARVEEQEERLTGSDILERDFHVLCCRLLIHREERGKEQLTRAKEQLWLQCFT